jgi:hypothetical protein
VSANLLDAFAAAELGFERLIFWPFEQDQTEWQIEWQMELARVHSVLVGASLGLCSRRSGLLPAVAELYGDPWKGEGLRFDSVRGLRRSETVFAWVSGDFFWGNDQAGRRSAVRSRAIGQVTRRIGVARVTGEAAPLEPGGQGSAVASRTR